MKKLLFILFLITGFSHLSFGQPTADFSRSPAWGCEGGTVTFTNLSTGSVVSQLWDFGDGTTSADLNPTHVYFPVGTYTITLTVTDGGGLTDTHTDTYIVRAPNALFSMSSDFGCGAPATIFFTDQSSFPDTWLWDFGDGFTTSQVNPAHTYTTGGEFAVSLTVSDTNFGCISTFFDTVIISVPIADIGGDPFGYFGCNPLTVDFIDASTNNGPGTITDYLWDFGDGNTSTLQNPSHTYSTTGLFTVSLTVTNDLGCSSTDVFTDMIQVNGPIPNFTSTVTSATCTDFTVDFTDLSTSDVAMFTPTWDFGDGTTGSGTNITHTYTSYGNFDVTIIASDISSCSSPLTITNYITIDDPTAPVITCPGDQTESLSASCDYTLPDLTGLVTATDNCATNLTIVQSPPAGTVITSNQLITMQTTDENANTSTCSFSVLLIDDTNPIINCPANQNVSFDATCSYTLLDYTGLATTTDNCLAPVVTQSPAAGTVITTTQTVTLTATDASGNTNVCTFDVIPTDNTAPTISCPATINVNNDMGFCGAAVTFGTPVGIDNCSGALTTMTTGMASGSIFPIGTTTNTFEITDAVGLTGTCSFDITVIDIENPTISCPANITQDNDIGECGALISYTSPAISDNCTGSVLTQTAGLNSGSLFPIGTTTNTFIVTDPAGNTASCSFDIIIIDAENPEIVCDQNIESCDSIFTFLNPSVTDNCPGVSFTLSAGLPSGSLFPIGTSTTEFIATDANGNQSTCATTITRFATPTVNAGPDQFLEAGFFVTLSPTYTNSATFDWTPSTGLDNATSPTPIASPQEPTNYTVTVTSSDGCQSSDDISISLGLDIEINNFMSPNGDGKNDTWNIQGNYLLGDCAFRIHDSWGNLRYESQGYENDWDGTFEGEELPAGNYFYVIECSGKRMTGSITLIR